MTCPNLQITVPNGPALKIKIERHHVQVGVLCLKVRRLFGPTSSEDVELAARLVGVDLTGRIIIMGDVYARVEFVFSEPDMLNPGHVVQANGEIGPSSAILDLLASQLPPVAGQLEEPTAELPTA